MRVTAFVLASVLCVCGPACAQDWELYTSNDDGFKLDFPGAPKMTTTTFKSQYGADLPTHVYSAMKGQEKYSLTVVDYRDAPRLLDEKAKATCPKDYPDERSCGLTNAGRGYWKEDMAGAVLWATYGFLQRDAKLTHLAYAWQDLVSGHELQLLNPDQSRTFVFIAMHTDRLVAHAVAVLVHKSHRLLEQNRRRVALRHGTFQDVRRSTRTCMRNIPMPSRVSRS